MKTFAATLATLAFATSIAHAQPVEESPLDHDPATATKLAVTGTVIPLAMIGAAFAMPNDTETQRDVRNIVGAVGVFGAIVGPSLGNLYATNRIGDAKGIAIRATVGVGVGLAAVLWSAGHAVHSIPCDGISDGVCGESNDGIDKKMATTAVIGGLVVAGSIVWDIATAGRHAREHNAKQPISLMPTVVSTGGAATAGLGLGGRF